MYTSGVPARRGAALIPRMSGRPEGTVNHQVLQFARAAAGKEVGRPC